MSHSVVRCARVGCAFFVVACSGVGAEVVPGAYDAGVNAPDSGVDPRPTVDGESAIGGDDGGASDGGASDGGASDGGASDGGASDGGHLEPSGCVTDVDAGDHLFTCDEATYHVRLPVACTSGGCGVILDVHGMTLNGAIEDANTNLRAIGEREGYVVVQPNAPGRVPTTTWTPSKDYDKVWAFLGEVRKTYAIDSKRVHVTGYSLGAIMTWAFACKYGDVIASAAPVAQSGCDEKGLAAVKRQVPILYMSGRKDALVSFQNNTVPQRDDVVNAWGMGTPATIASDANYKWSRYTNATGTVFEFIEHEYSAGSPLLKGHCFPGSTDDGSAPGQLFSYACTPPNAFTWGEEVMHFFKAHPMP